MSIDLPLCIVTCVFQQHTSKTMSIIFRGWWMRRGEKKEKQREVRRQGERPSGWEMRAKLREREKAYVESTSGKENKRMLLCRPKAWRPVAITEHLVLGKITAQKKKAKKHVSVVNEKTWQRAGGQEGRQVIRMHRTHRDTDRDFKLRGPLSRLVSRELPAVAMNKE